ncbi:MAG: M20 family metallopeptidase [Ignavibacteria bacterium]|nr:M20 family metallopeptidase [Ignavibacteria bacterium]
MTKDKIFEEIDKVFDNVIRVRRHLHLNPELSFREYLTCQTILNYLNGLGIEGKVISETGVVAKIGNGNRAIAFRADIDALPIKEETGLPFSSRNDGVMHACGHDIHSATLLGVAEILKKYEDYLPNSIVFIFQPGEEKLPGGAKRILEEGLLEKEKVEAIFAQHTDPETEVGKISLSPNEILASSDELYWTIRGKSTHAAEPQKGTDPIRTSVAIVNALYSLAQSTKNPLEPVVLAITSIQGGTATNIYPDVVKIMGTLRTFNESLRYEILKKIKFVSETISNAYSTECLFEPILGYPSLVNHKELTEFVRKIGIEVLGEENVANFEKKMWAEDFAYYSRVIPAVFWFLGVKPKGYNGEFYGLHSSRFNPSEESMKFAMAMFVKIAFAYSN